MEKTWTNVMFVAPDSDWSGLSRFVLGRMSAAAGAPIPADAFVTATFWALKKLYGGAVVGGKLTLNETGLHFKPSMFAGLAVTDPKAVHIPREDLRSARFTGQALVMMFSPRLPMAHIETSSGEVRVVSQFGSKQIAEMVNRLAA